MPLKPFPETKPDPNKIDYDETRLGSCGECGGHVVLGRSGSGGMPAPAKCKSCGYEMNHNKIPMKPPAPKGKAPPNYAKAKGAAKAGYASLKAKKSMV